MAISPEALRRLSVLLDTALDLPESERATWLSNLAGDDAALAPTLHDLLVRQASRETADLLERPPAFTVAGVEPAASELHEGNTVGAYRLERLLGSGGMGEVWLAERIDGSLKRKVALKLPHVGWAPGLAERFAREREILSGLEHPNIARLYDAGVDQQGRPYMALEYVDGQPLDEYCNSRALSIDARLKLLLQVAEAMAFAHSRLVLHRDLKPGNMLVTADGQVRLLDFGIAKLMEGDATRETVLTRVSGRALTLDYASPEQIRGEPIGTASDVYSLGVVAFELLAGARPYRLKRGSAAELEEAITGADAPLASELADNPAVRKLLKGDLDATLNKALKKQVSERYPTIEALAQDWRHHLAGHGVTARPDTLTYRLTRFARRHRLPLGAGVVTVAAFGLALGFGATALVILALLIGLGVALWQARKARQQAHIAGVEARTAQEVQNFLEGIFRASGGDQADPIKARQRSAKDLLDDGAARIDKALDQAPQAKLRVLMTLATIYDDLGETERMADMLQKRVEVVERITPGAGADRALAHAELAMALAVIGRDGEAQSHLARAEAALRPLPDADDDAHRAVEMAVAQFYAARGDARGLQASRRLVSRLRSRPPSLEVTVPLMLKGKLERLSALPADAVQTLNGAVEMAKKLPGGGENTMHVLLVELALAEADLGQPDVALEHMRQAVRIAEKNAGPSSPTTIITLARLSQLLTEQGRPRDAIEPLLEARRRVDADPALVALSGVVGPQRFHEGQARRRLGQLDEALMCYSDSAKATSGPNGSADGAFRSALGQALVLTDQGCFDEAQRALAEARAIRKRADLRGYGQALTLVQAEVTFALACGENARAGEAWRMFADDPTTTIHRQDASMVSMEAELTLATAGPATAVELARRALAMLQASPTKPNSVFDQLRLLLVLARGLRMLGKASEALAPLQAAMRDAAPVYDPTVSVVVSDLHVALAEALLASGKMDFARNHLDSAKAIQSRHAQLGPHYTEPVRELETRLGSPL